MADPLYSTDCNALPSLPPPASSPSESRPVAWFAQLHAHSGTTPGVGVLSEHFTRSPESHITVTDRSLLYGDGLFETIRFENSFPRQFHRHWKRISTSAQILGFTLPASSEQVLAAASHILQIHDHNHGLLRLTLSRGPGPRGYSALPTSLPWILLTVHPGPSITPGSPSTARLVTSNWRLYSADPLAPHKSANRLLQVLARTEADAAGADEALMLNELGHFVEASSANLFWWESDGLHTPPPSAGILPGITRALILEMCPDLGIAIHLNSPHPERIRKAEGVFLTQTSTGIVEAISLDGYPLRHSRETAHLHAALTGNLNRGTGHLS